MARPRTISDTQILAAAREVFLEQGFSATTAEIARRAGISEGTLFKRFPTKEDLFAEAIGLSDFTSWREELSGLAGQGDVRRNLERAALHFLDHAARVVPHLMLVFSRGHDPSHNPLLETLNHPVQQDTRAVADYLRAESGRGRLRPLDADVTALLLMGALTQYVHLEMLPCSAREHIDPGRFVRGLLDVVWPGLEP
ncbi:TetR/AcrR family transcriptional regulator [Deinococcus hopiensis]|uniref:Transcriptional regulator, TetR family n=1 Tax=Deinococcus hopiensis KR-140 TaxID=695939 RepID=A0A1W1VQN4_9DEIO|nr:TetR/AcrR family transcriptional regulator [Deinococcus hopiensis]SMB95657.1 transcriptional regulator, TetR family [Deinococcus hopiensis KR-140]